MSTQSHCEENSVSYASAAKVSAAFVPATDEDVAIFRRMSIQAHARALKADRRDAALMLTAQWPYQTYLPRGVRA